MMCPLLSGRLATVGGSCGPQRTFGALWLSGKSSQIGVSAMLGDSACHLAHVDFESGGGNVSEGAHVRKFESAKVRRCDLLGQTSGPWAVH
eukprot:1388353-Alexandrium_andersonii.AAC.1